MTDMEVYLLCTLGKEQYGLTNASLARLLQSSFLHHDISERDVEGMQKQEVGQRSMIKALHRLGFPQVWIAERLKTSPANISYHMKHLPTTEWTCNYWLNVLSGNRTALNIRSQSYKKYGILTF